MTSSVSSLSVRVRGERAKPLSITVKPTLVPIARNTSVRLTPRASTDSLDPSYITLNRMVSSAAVEVAKQPSPTRMIPTVARSVTVSPARLLSPFIMLIFHFLAGTFADNKGRVRKVRIMGVLQIECNSWPDDGQSSVLPVTDPGQETE